MKKNIFPFTVALMLPLACTQIEEPSATLEGGDGTLLVISASSSPVAKTVLDEDNSVSFLETDALSVFCQIEDDEDVSYEKNKFSVSRLYDDGSADFAGRVASAEGSMPVMYPYQEEAKIEKYGKTYKLYLTVPVEQKAFPGTFDPDAAISLGMASAGEDGGVGVSLCNACALVRFAVPPGEYSKVTLNAVGREICGPCYAGVGTTIGDISISTGGETMPESTVSLKGDIEGGNIYLLAVVPGEATGGITVRLYDRDGNLVGEKTTTNPVTFTKGHILNIGLLPTSSPTWTGSGTVSAPYQIQTSAHLKLLAQAFSIRETAILYAGKHFLQTDNINMDGKEITIGNYKDRSKDTSPAWDVPTCFNAVYDGGGYKIVNYRLKFINKDGHYYAGLFNCVKDAEIKNLEVRPAVSERGNLIDGIDDINGYYNIGMLVGYLGASTRISGCKSLARDSVAPYVVDCTEKTGFLETPLTVNLGGLVGYASAAPGYEVNLSGCTNEAHLRLENGSNKIVVGGIIGAHNEDSFSINVDRCRNKGSVAAVSGLAEAFAGGIFGRISDGPSGDILVRITNCVNEGSINATTNAREDACAGGIAGSNNSDGWGALQFRDEDPWVYNSLNKGDIYANGADAMAGGIFGYCYDEDTRLVLCVNTGRITATGGSRTYSTHPISGPICATGGYHHWCFWLVPDEFKGYAPKYNHNCHACSESISGSATLADTPEYVRCNGKSDDGETGDDLFKVTGWSAEVWDAMAPWTGISDVYWDDPDHDHLNTLDLTF